MVGESPMDQNEEPFDLTHQEIETLKHIAYRATHGLDAQARRWVGRR